MAALAVLLLCATVGLMVGGAPPVMVWGSCISTVIAALHVMMSERQ
ncbi:hypothetical protein HQ314_17680 [Rhodococcus sp. BP-332]|nr:hypothetical protein [Rhodococcus sp. BP-332]MBY6678750.1 hypothetical protein [Rhodococcus sp. BP-332]